jgi:hypothetical protein
MGRDRLFEELRERHLLVPRLPRQWPQTTRYNLSLPVFHNEIKELEVHRTNEVWVADLTYVRTEEGFMFSLLAHRQMLAQNCEPHVGGDAGNLGAIGGLEPSPGGTAGRSQADSSLGSVLPVCQSRICWAITAKWTINKHD